jgi:hypothetical protein
MGEAKRRQGEINELKRRRAMQIKVPIDQLKDRVCPKCQGMLFIQMMVLKELPPVYSPSGQYETNMSLVGFGCVACGTVISLRPEPEKTLDGPVEGQEKPKSGIVLATH